MSTEKYQFQVAVITASSTSGTACVKTLLDSNQGPRVRAVFRTESKAASIRDEYGDHERLEIVTGVDAADKKTLISSMEGCEIAFLVTPSDPSKDMKDDAAFTANMIKAALEAGVRHVILAASWTVIAPTQVSTIAMRFLPSEELLIALGKSYNLKWTVLRGGYFHSNYAMFADALTKGDEIKFPDYCVPSIDASDIGRVAAAIAKDRGEGHKDRVYEISGPEKNSLSDFARILSDVLERDIRFVDIPFEQCADGLPLFLRELIGYLNSKGEGAVPMSNDVREVTGVAPLSLREWVKNNRSIFE